jgi:hypothetical protein
VQQLAVGESHELAEFIVQDQELDDRYDFVSRRVSVSQKAILVVTFVPKGLWTLANKLARRARRNS